MKEKTKSDIFIFIGCLSISAAMFYVVGSVTGSLALIGMMRAGAWGITGYDCDLRVSRETLRGER